MAALTASAQSALPDRSWDEMIVPALRKRLESESRAISKRMSAASIPSSDEIIQSHTPSRPTSKSKPIANGAIAGKSAPVPSTPSEKPSAIPRPSLNYSRPIMTSPQGPSNVATNNTSKVQSTRPSSKRSRTYSQPYPFDPSEENDSGATTTSANRTPHPNNSILPTPVSSRPNSPSTTTTASTLRPTEAKPTRIPKVTNTGKTIAINGQAKGGEGDKQAHAFLTPEASPETLQVYENGHLANSQSSLNVPRHSRQNGGPVLLHEEPPFSAASSIEAFGDQHTSRRSMEDETPFEHWYRGDLSRNGGVGELRIGNRMEMLEIANYGHRLRQNIASASGPYGSKRRRAGSIGGGRERDSVVFDDTYEAIDMVLDEMPLTDMEGDTETEREMSFTREAQSQAAQTAQLLQQQPQQAHVRTVSAAGSASRIPTSQQRSVSASTSHEQQARSRKNSQIPRPQQTSSQTQGGASARSNGVPTEAQFNTPARAYAAANMPFSAANESLQPLATSTPKRGRAKSPATPSKKAKTRPNIRSKSAVDVRTTKEEDIAEYPDMPDDSQLADAIPTWTKPVPKGNWDEVVLPVVARKMGLDDQYEQETGVPQPRKDEEEIIPPQPGTFGITPPRPRPPREGKVHSGSDENENASSSDHWDEKTAQAETKDEVNVTTPPQTPEPKTSRRAPPQSMNLADAKRPMSRRREDPPSPAPFAHYTQTPAMQNMIERPVTPPMVSRREEEDGAGCCRCVIM